MLAAVSPIKPRKACITPSSFQWRARQSWHYPRPSSRTRRHEVVLAPMVVKRRFSESEKLRKDSEIGSENSFDRFSLSQPSSTEHTSEISWDGEPRVSESENSITAANGAAAVNHGSIGARVRKAMRCVPQSVTVVTSTDVSTGRPVFRGATISSFNTVTMEPSTIVSLNIKRPSSTFDAIESSGYFLVHLLGAYQTSSELAQAFTMGSSHTPFLTLERISQIRLSEDSGHVPKLNAGPPAIDCRSPGHFLCRYIPDKTVEVGDHVVIFGTVERVTKQVSETACLVYANGHYGRVSPLELSATLKITRAAFDAFVVKTKKMDHHCLHSKIFSMDHLNRLGPGLRASFQTLRVLGQELFDFVVYDDIFQIGSSVSIMGLGTRRMSALGNGILEAISFYLIFLEPSHSVVRMLPQLPSEAVEECEKYQIAAHEIREEVLDMKASLERFYDPLSTLGQPFVSDVYSLKKVLQANREERFQYLKNYIRNCLPPMNIPPSAVPRPRLLVLLERYNANLRKIWNWMYFAASRIDDPFTSQTSPARAQARAAIMRIRRRDLLLFPDEPRPRQIQLLEALSVEFAGVDDALMASLKRYGAACKQTASHLTRYKGFLDSSELYDHKRDGPGRRERDDQIEMKQHVGPLTLSGRAVNPWKVQVMKPQPLVRMTPQPLVRRHMGRKSEEVVKDAGRSLEIVRKYVVPTSEVVRKHVLRESDVVRKHVGRDRETVRKYVRLERDIERPVGRITVSGPITEEPAEEDIRIKLEDPFAWRVRCAERREESIRQGLQFIDKLMADERRTRA